MFLYFSVLCSIVQIMFRDQAVRLTPLRSPFLAAPAFPAPVVLRAAPACRPVVRRTSAPALCWTSAELTRIIPHLCLSAMPFAAAVTPALIGWCRRGCSSTWRFSAPAAGAGEFGRCSKYPEGCLCASMQGRWSALQRPGGGSSARAPRRIITSSRLWSTRGRAPLQKHSWTRPRWET